MVNNHGTREDFPEYEPFYFTSSEMVPLQKWLAKDDQVFKSEVSEFETNKEYMDSLTHKVNIYLEVVDDRSQ